MFLKQWFDENSSTYTYLLADLQSKEAVIIDPVTEHTKHYIEFLENKDLKLVAALDTHVHADHVTALGQLRDVTGASTFLGKPGDVSCADNPLIDKQCIHFGRYALEVIFTPGHTDDSYCFYLKQDEQPNLLFTGDTLLIGGTGRTDFQNGDPGKLYDSLHEKILALPQDTIVYPGHDYHGKTQSTIRNELASNVRINIKDKPSFIDFMNRLNLPDPKQMDVAVPANKSCGNNPFNKSRSEDNS